MRIKVLGSAAGGGFPQWNCHCRNCAGARDGTLNTRPRSQSSLAATADGERWLVFNASPDLPAQIRATPELRSPQQLRGTRIAAVALTDGQIDHATGLLLLREGARLPLYCTELVRDDLSSAFPVLRILDHYCGVDWHPVAVDGRSFAIETVPGIELRAVALASKPAPYSSRREAPRPGDNVGFVLRDQRSRRAVFYAPGLAEIDEHAGAAMRDAECLLVDGTFWSDDEMIRLGVGRKRAQEIGHLAQSGPGGMVEALREFRHARRILIHINNTNPILDEDSEERRLLEREGIEVAFDGMELEV